MTIFEKMNIVKSELLKLNLKKSGANKFAGFNYYELGDFLPSIVDLCRENGLYTHITFDNEKAELSIYDANDKDQPVLKFSSPMRNLVLKGCNEIQALGGVETYQRRYLYMVAFDITENDLFDSVSGSGNFQQITKKDITKDYDELIKKVKEKILSIRDDGDVRTDIQYIENTTTLKVDEYNQLCELGKRLKEGL
ncbi:MAG: ERF family protein [Rickettsiales bacterium]|jgi:hypothetical protein|nr:ERF family protein [Rickettsiales bacterium]